MPSEQPLMYDHGPGSVRLSWRPASLPAYGASSAPITYTIFVQVRTRYIYILLRSSIHYFFICRVDLRHLLLYITGTWCAWIASSRSTVL